MKEKFDALILAISSCNQELYASLVRHQSAPAAKEQLDPETIEHLLIAVSQVEQRSHLLQQLVDITPFLDQHEINQLGHLYQTMLLSDKKDLPKLQAERESSYQRLRAIKNADKALPLYRAYSR